MASYLPLSQGQIAFVLKIYPELNDIEGFFQKSSKFAYSKIPAHKALR